MPESPAQADLRVPRTPEAVPLLARITQQSMDEDYLHAAERRVLARDGGPPRRSHRVAAAMLAVFGVLVTTAAVQTSRNADVNDASRSTLVARIEEQRDRVSGLQDRILGLRRVTADLEEQAARLAEAEQATESDLRRLQVRTGFVPVTGPGLRIVVDDPERGPERIRKSDLFLLVNALWAAGAEAISLNGHRLSVLTSINNSNAAINVDDHPLLPPYTLLAVGDPRTLAAELIETSSFGRFDHLRSQYGFGFDRQNEESMALPAASPPRLRHATARKPDVRTDKEVNP